MDDAAFARRLQQQLLDEEAAEQAERDREQARRSEEEDADLILARRLQEMETYPDEAAAPISPQYPRDNISPQQLNHQILKQPYTRSPTRQEYDTHGMADRGVNYSPELMARDQPSRGARPQGPSTAQKPNRWATQVPVSYTHLTLPTKA